MAKWTRNEALVNTPPVETWPQVAVEAIDAAIRELYLARADAMRKYFSNEPVKTIERVTGVRASQLPQFARRCLEISDDGLIAGFRALIPYIRTKSYERTAPVDYKFPEDQGGMAGSLGALLKRFPELEQQLLRHIRQDAKSQKVREVKLRPRDLHRIFIKLLRELGVQDDEWPFITKYRGKRTIEKYMRSVLDENFDRTVATRGSEEAKAHAHVNTGHDIFLMYEEPFAAIEIDAQCTDAHLTVKLETPDGTETEVVLDRLWHIAAIDRFSTAILAYRVIYRSQVTADDVLHVISDAVSKRWQPCELTIPIRYPPHSGLPSGVIDEAFGVSWTMLLLDGALAHLSKAIHVRARKALGFSINWGPVAKFERRPNVEQYFNKTARDIFKRLPSTTGGGPSKGRAKDGEKTALTNHIQAEEVLQQLDVYTAQHNLLPASGVFHLSPLEVLRQFLCDKKRDFLPRYLPKDVMNYAKKFNVRVSKIVRGSRDNGRRPYVELDGAHYTSPILANAGYLIGTTIWIDIDEDDYRQVNAYLENGAQLGILRAQGKWAITKHSRRTRKAINSLVYKRILVFTEFDDPIQEYMRHISKPQPGKSPKDITSSQATELTRLATEAGDMPRILAQKPNLPLDRTSINQIKVVNILEAKQNFFSKVKNRK